MVPIKLSFKVKKIKKLFTKDSFFFLNTFSILNLFLKKPLKLLFYIFIFKFFVNMKARNILFVLKKKLKSYFFLFFKENRMVLSISLGSILRFFRLQEKWLKKSKKGFVLYLNTVKKFVTRYRRLVFSRSVFINFVDSNLIYFLTRLSFLFKNRIKLFLNFNTFNKTKKCKKLKSIKKRILKKKMEVFLKDWKLINRSKVPHLNLYKV